VDSESDSGDGEGAGETERSNKETDAFFALNFDEK